MPSKKKKTKNLSGPITRPIISGPITTPIISGPITTPIISGPITRPIISGPITRPIISGPITRPITYGPFTYAQVTYLGCFAKPKAVNLLEKKPLSIKCTSENLKCPQCYFMATNYTNLKSHLNIFHYEVLPNRVVRKCKNPKVHNRTNVPKPRSILSYKNRNHNVDFNRKRIFYCTKCDYQNVKRKGLKKHKDSCHVKEKIFQCRQCDFKNSKRKLVKQHVDKVHQIAKIFSCECGYKYGKRELLKQHRDSFHNKSKRFQCRLCRFYCTKRQVLRQHYNLLHHRIVKSVYWNNCYNNGTKRKLVRKHTSSISRSKFRPYKYFYNLAYSKLVTYTCSLCEFKSSRSNDVLLHFDLHSRSSNAFRCPLCDYSSSNLKYYKQHADILHSVTNIFKCSQCDYIAFRKSILEKHIGSVHRVKESTMFSKNQRLEIQSSNLKLSSSSTYQKFKFVNCPKCNYSGFDISSLNRHYYSVHRKSISFKTFQSECSITESSLTKHCFDTIRKELKCLQCNYLGTGKKDLKYHIHAAHRKVKTLFKCHQCQYSCTKRKGLKRHIYSVHRGIRSFKCLLCDYSSTRRKDLQRHSDSVHKETRTFKQCVISGTNSNEYKNFICSVQNYLHNRYIINLLMCLLCQYTCTGTINMKHHFDSVHSTSYVQCPECEYLLTNRTDLIIHLTSVHSFKTDSLRCRGCRMVIPREWRLKIHIDSGNYEMIIKCPLCEFCSPPVKEFLHHFSMVHTNKNCLWCAICECEFSNRLELEIHISLKHCKCLLKCNTCQYLATDRYDMKNHIDSANDGINSFKCFYCKCHPFMSNNNRNKRILYGCPICKLNHSNNNKLVEHIYSRHCEKNSIVCPICEHLDTSVKNLKRHFISHCETVNKCNFCKYSTTNLRNLDDHVDSDHPKLNFLDSCFEKPSREQKPYKCFRCKYSGVRMIDLKRHTRAVHARGKLKCVQCDVTFESDTRKKMFFSKNFLMSCKNCGGIDH